MAGYQGLFFFFSPSEGVCVQQRPVPAGPGVAGRLQQSLPLWGRWKWTLRLHWQVTLPLTSLTAARTRWFSTSAYTISSESTPLIQHINLALLHNEQQEHTIDSTHQLSFITQSAVRAHHWFNTSTSLYNQQWEHNHLFKTLVSLYYTVSIKNTPLIEDILCCCKISTELATS